MSNKRKTYQGHTIVFDGDVWIFEHRSGATYQNSELSLVENFIYDFIQVKPAINPLPVLYFRWPNRSAYCTIVGLQAGIPVIEELIHPEVPMLTHKQFWPFWLANEKAEIAIPLIAEKQNKLDILYRELGRQPYELKELIGKLSHCISYSQVLDLQKSMFDLSEKILPLEQEIAVLKKEISDLKWQMDMVTLDMIKVDNHTPEQKKPSSQLHSTSLIKGSINKTVNKVNSIYKQKQKRAAPAVSVRKSTLSPLNLLASKKGMAEKAGKIVIQNPELLKIDKNGKFKKAAI